MKIEVTDSLQSMVILSTFKDNKVVPVWKFMKNIILDSNDITNKIRRISFEIIEKNIDEKEIYLIGILPNGRYLSQKINSCLLYTSPSPRD